ncbi:hypothetical protein [Acinetobacter sp. NIPH 298]|uniref:hypothetical protein n=1 Tax=Acinetobacter sp. NIPH 298 TaxID=1217692 RepID=UPI0002CE48EC|nr:hypothetical protein [Acinetobacter sp. NIPH 298]ENW95579.1 hypothetical protein F903_01340 [Acinetobacter sp. NIPH 298]
MIQEKPTSLRILQTNKKKTLSPVIHLFIGFLSGIIFSLLIFFIFFKAQSHQEPNESEQAEVLLPPPTSMQQDSQSTHVIEFTAQESTESDEDSNFTQPQSSELNKFFQHAAPPPVNSGQQTSPFPIGHNAGKTAQPKTPQLSNNKNGQTPVSDKVNKITTQPTKTNAAKEVEVEAEAPEATVQINVTQRPFSVNELK